MKKKGNLTTNKAIEICGVVNVWNVLGKVYTSASHERLDLEPHGYEIRY